MEPDARRRLIEAVEQARVRAAEAIDGIEEDEDSPGAVESAVRDAEAALSRLAAELRADG